MQHQFKEFCKDYSEIESSSFIDEHFIMETHKSEIRSSSSQVYNSKNDGNYQNFKELQKWLFYNFP